MSAGGCGFFGFHRASRVRPQGRCSGRAGTVPSLGPASEVGSLGNGLEVGSGGVGLLRERVGVLPSGMGKWRRVPGVESSGEGPLGEAVRGSSAPSPPVPGRRRGAGPAGRVWRPMPSAPCKCGSHVGGFYIH